MANSASYRQAAEDEIEAALPDHHNSGFHLARAQVYATLAISAQMEEDEWWRRS